MATRAAEAGLRAIPFRAVQCPRDNVEGPGPVDILTFTIDSERHSHLANDSFDVGLAIAKVACAECAEIIGNLTGGSPRRTVAADQFVEKTGRAVF